MASHDYGILNRSFDDAGKEFRITPFDVRVLVLLHEREGQLTSDRIAHELVAHDSAVRRSLLTLYAKRLADGESVNGGRRRPGQRTLVTITPAGALVAKFAAARAAALQDLDTERTA